MEAFPSALAHMAQPTPRRRCTGAHTACRRARPTMIAGTGRDAAGAGLGMHPPPPPPPGSGPVPMAGTPARGCTPRVSSGSSTSRPKKSKTGLIVALVALLAAGGGIAAFVVLGKKDRTTTAAAAAAAGVIAGRRERRGSGSVHTDRRPEAAAGRGGRVGVDAAGAATVATPTAGPSQQRRRMRPERGRPSAQPAIGSRRRPSNVDEFEIWENGKKLQDGTRDVSSHSGHVADVVVKAKGFKDRSRHSSTATQTKVEVQAGRHRPAATRRPARLLEGMTIRRTRSASHNIAQVTQTTYVCARVTRTAGGRRHRMWQTLSDGRLEEGT